MMAAFFLGNNIDNTLSSSLSPHPNIPTHKSDWSYLYLISLPSPPTFSLWTTSFYFFSPPLSKYSSWGHIQIFSLSFLQRLIRPDVLVLSFENMTPGHEICLTHPLFHCQASSADTEYQHTGVRRVGRYVGLRGSESPQTCSLHPSRSPAPEYPSEASETLPETSSEETECDWSLGALGGRQYKRSRGSLGGKGRMADILWPWSKTRDRKERQISV